MRYVSTGRCKECANSDARLWQKTYPEESKKAKRDRYWKNIEKEHMRAKVYRLANSDKIKIYYHAWRIKNLEKERARVRANQAENPEKTNAICAKRRAKKLNATPPWLTKEHFIQIEEVYAVAKQRTKETGIPHEVDHIHPLQGKEFNGLQIGRAHV